jgi:hypothetical protein
VCWLVGRAWMMGHDAWGVSYLLGYNVSGTRGLLKVQRWVRGVCLRYNARDELRTRERPMVTYSQRETLVTVRKRPG